MAATARKSASTKRTASKKTASKKTAAKKTSAAQTRDPAGGLTAAGREAFHARDGSNLQPGVTRSEAEMSPEEMKRKGSWAVRFYGRDPLPPLVDAKGASTRFALSAHAWGEPVPKNETEARRIAEKGRRLLERYRAKSAAAKTAAAKKPAAKTAATKKTPAAKAPAKKAAAGKKTPGTRATAAKTPSGKVAPKKAPSRQLALKASPSGSSTARKAPVAKS